MAAVGDRVEVPSKRVGQAPRHGVVIGASASGLMLQVRWSSGEESTITPSMGSLVVVGRARVRDGQGTGAAKRAGAKKGGGTAKTGTGSKKGVGPATTASKKAAKSPKPTWGTRAKGGGGKGSGKGGRAAKRAK